MASEAVAAYGTPLVLDLSGVTLWTPPESRRSWRSDVEHWFWIRQGRVELRGATRIVIRVLSLTDVRHLLTVVTRRSSQTVSVRLRPARMDKSPIGGPRDGDQATSCPGPR